MGRGSNTNKSESFQKYGVPFYSAAWVPRNKLDHSDQYYAVLAGGGGEGRSGIPNAVVLSKFDFPFNSLSPHPVVKVETGSKLPYRTVIHPGGDGIICAFPNNCQFYEWDDNDEEGKEEEEAKDNEKAQKLGLKESEKVLTELEDVGQQLALAFNSDSSVFAAGGEDGKLRVFKWPSMESILNESEAKASIKDLCFSPDGKFLASLEGRALCRVWDVTSSTAVASLSKKNDEVFACCRFSHSDQTQVLYIAANTDKGVSIITWDSSSWKRVCSRHITRDGVCSFNVSPDGKFLAIGTTQGDLLLINATSMRVQTVVRKAHLGMVTALAFSHDSRALVSASMDSSARVTLVEQKKSGGSSLWLIIFIILLAIVAYFMKKGRLLPFLA